MTHKSPDYNVASIVSAALIGRGDAIAMDCGDGPLSRRDMLTQIARRQAQFTESGVADGTRVVISTSRGASFWIDMIALWALGAIAVPLNPDVSNAHAEAIFAAARPTHVNQSFAPMPQAFADLAPISDLPALSADEPSQLPAFAAVAPNDLAGLFFTSGTTGLPKGVMIRHEMLIANMMATQSRIKLKATDRLFIAIPFRFISSISHILVAIVAGATFVGTEDRLAPADLVDRLDAHDVTAFGGAPVQLRFLSDALPTRLKSLRWMMSSGDHLSPEIIAKIRDIRPEMEIHTVYGLTEVAGRFCSLPAELIDVVPGSVGVPIAGMRVHVLDEDGTPCPPGEVGEVFANGLCCFEGYIGNAEATAKALTPYGFRTGDLGYMDDSGYLYLSGRSDSVFKRAGLKVSCLPIQDALMKLGQFEDVAVMPKDNDLAGAVPVAYYVLKDGVVFNRGEVLKALRQALPPNHLPAEFLALPTIPRTGSGKIQRQDLLDLIAKAEAS